MKQDYSQIRAKRHTEQMAHSPKYNEWVRASWQPIWVKNAARSYALIESIFAKRNADISALPNKSGPLLVLGSGPSLDDWVPYIKNWKGDIACSTSQLLWLEAMGRNPTYVFLIDSDPTMNYLIHDYRPIEGQPIPDFITHPSIQREAIMAWNRPEHTWFFRMLDPGDDFFTKYTPMIYQSIPTVMPGAEKPTDWGIKTYVMNSGCVPNTMVAFGQMKGYSPIIFAGFDLGYPKKQYRFQNYKPNRKPDGTTTWEIEPKTVVPKDRPWKPSHNGVPTDELCLFYKYSTLILYAMQTPPLLTSSRGIVDEMPHISPKEAVTLSLEDMHKRLLAPEAVFDKIQEYLAHRKIYCTRTGFSMGVQNTVGMKPLKRIRMVLEWYYWRSRKDYAVQGAWWQMIEAKKNFKKAKREAIKAWWSKRIPWLVKKQPYDFNPPAKKPEKKKRDRKPSVTGFADKVLARIDAEGSATIRMDIKNESV